MTITLFKIFIQRNPILLFLHWLVCIAMLIDSVLTSCTFGIITTNLSEFMLGFYSHMCAHYQAKAPIEFTMAIRTEDREE